MDQDDGAAAAAEKKTMKPSDTPFAQRRENVGLPDHVYRQVDELERALAAARRGGKMSTEKSETPRMTAACRDARGIDEGCKLELELAVAILAAAQLHERLEDNYAYDNNGQRIKIEPGFVPDGISCRDETIRILDIRLNAANQRAERMQNALAQIAGFPCIGHGCLTRLDTCGSCIAHAALAQEQASREVKS